ncbi:MAG: osmoprotectant transport system substrate-binding protein [Solirubrobacteraceae bacterium]|jgi:osmoprotectant transport system substrate-binding protein|nr:osmoprotectant transport system substrate-binding protein [Solirubrobacteraceae bacterium]
MNHRAAGRAAAVRGPLLTCALALVLVLSACGGDDGTTKTNATSSGPPVRIGTKNFTEQYILGELYKQALEAKGFAVELKGDVGSSEIIHQALVGGALDMYPEYVDLLLSEVANVRKRPRKAAAVYRAAKAYEQGRGFTLLAQTPFNDANAIAVRKEYASRHGLRTIADLRRVHSVTLGAPPEFRTRFEGLMGLEELYRLKNLKLKRMKIPGQYAQLAGNHIDAARVNTTDGQLADRDFELLADPHRLFAANHVAPVISRKALSAHGQRLVQTIDAVSAKLTTSAMRKMNAAVDIDGRTPRDVAAAFLREAGLRT